jgi:hypothetical protein
LTGAGDALLDEPTTEISVDDSTLGSVDGFKQARIRDVLSTGEASEPLRLENPQKYTPLLSL